MLDFVIHLEAPNGDASTEADSITGPAAGEKS